MPLDFAIRPNRIPWPPLIYAGAIGLALALDRLYPQVSGAIGDDDGVWLLGVAVMAAGAAFDLSAMLAMWRHRANIMPHRAATALVTSGPFALSRNPIYLGNAIMLAGAAPTFGNFWFLALVPVVVALVTVLAIRREERHLATLFGGAWTAYAARTPRWFGRRAA
jgi:protein-S-isoprenylcysteine O-methyltransferase Ste14